MSELVVKNLDIPMFDNEENLRAKKTYKLKETNKPFRVFTKDMLIDDIFQELETTRNDEGDIINTRLSKEAQDYMKLFFQGKGVEFNDTGYLSLRGVFYDLNRQDRIDLCRNLSIKFNLGVDVDRALDEGKSFFDKAGKAAAGVALGVGAGTIINNTNPTLITDKIGTVAKDAINRTVSSQEFQDTVNGALTNIATDALNDPSLKPNLINTADKVIDDMDFGLIGNLGKGTVIDTANNAINGINPGDYAGDVENMITDLNLSEKIGNEANNIVDTQLANNAVPINLIAGGIAGLVAVPAISKLYNNVSSRIKTRKNSREFYEIDSKLYAEDNKVEMDNINQLLNPKAAQELSY